MLSSEMIDEDTRKQLQKSELIRAMENKRLGSRFQEIKSQAKQATSLSQGKGPDKFCSEGYQKYYKLVNLCSYFSLFKWGCFLGLSCPCFTHCVLSICGSHNFLVHDSPDQEEQHLDHKFLVTLMLRLTKSLGSIKWG